MAATIDEVSGGRFVLGLGSGWNRREFDAFGIPYDKRVSRFEEAFTIIRGLLAGERVTLDGDVPPRGRRGAAAQAGAAVPLMLGSNGPRMLVDRRRALHGVEHVVGRLRQHARGLRRARRRSSRPHLERSACMLVQLDGRRWSASRRCRAVPKRASPTRSGNWARPAPTRSILVASPITERSIRALGEALPARRPARRPSLRLASASCGLLGADQLLRLTLGRDRDDVPREADALHQRR